MNSTNSNYARLSTEMMDRLMADAYAHKNERIITFLKALRAEEELYGLFVEMRQLDVEAGRTFNLAEVLERTKQDIGALHDAIRENVNTPSDDFGS
jgi:hypothetical protein